MLANPKIAIHLIIMKYNKCRSRKYKRNSKVECFSLRDRERAKSTQIPNKQKTNLGFRSTINSVIVVVGFRRWRHRGRSHCVHINIRIRWSCRRQWKRHRCHRTANGNRRSTRSRSGDSRPRPHLGKLFAGSLLGISQSDLVAWATECAGDVHL